MASSPARGFDMKHRHNLIIWLSLYLSMGGCEAKVFEGDPQLFGVYTATLDGNNMTLLLANPTQEMTHLRLSPDKQWITFTRYNKKGPGGLAREEFGYMYTEVMLMRADGTDVQTLVAPQKGIINANSSWTPDGKGIIFVSTDNPQRKPRVYQMDLESRQRTRVPTPQGLDVADPHWIVDCIVFPVHQGQAYPIWAMKPDGSRAEQLTYPQIPLSRQDGKFQLGDYDPRLSPDGSKVVFMRYFGNDNWHVVVFDRITGKEQDLSPAESVDAVPTWSSDGALLIFWHANLKNLPETGLYTMKPDGSDRKRIPLPRGYHHKSPHFFPGEGSSDETRIIFSARKDPQL